MSGEARRAFVDSNVLIYAHDRSAGTRHEQAGEILANLWQTQTGALSIQVLQEFFVNVTSKITSPITIADARRIVSDFIRWRTHEPTGDDVLEAIDIHRDHQISFWDAMIVRSASETECDVLFTEDLSAGQTYRGVRAENPFA